MARNEPKVTTYFRGLMAANRARRTTMKKSGLVQTSNGVLNEALSRAMADLCMLNTQTQGRSRIPTPASPGTRRPSAATG